MKLKYRTLHTARSCTSTTVDISFRFLIFRGRASGPIKYHRPYVTASCNWYCILTASFHVIVRTGDYARRCRPREAVGSKGRINVSPYSPSFPRIIGLGALSPSFRKGINRVGKKTVSLFRKRFSSCVRLRETDFFNPRGNRTFYLVENVGE